MHSSFKPSCVYTQPARSSRHPTTASSTCDLRKCMIPACIVVTIELALTCQYMYCLEPNRLGLLKQIMHIYLSLGNLGFRGASKVFGL